MIIDSAIIEVRSGKGGDGCRSFRREKHVAKGGPDGGCGGDGGHVVLVADPEVETLLDFSGRHHWKAPHGENGASANCHGENGNDLLVRLPVGTLVYDEPLEEAVCLDDIDPEEDPEAYFATLFMSAQERAAIAAPDPDSKPTGELIVDLAEPNQRFVIAQGGKGGRGNKAFATPTHQAPREVEEGEPSETRRLRLELKLMADVGLLGKPNAGKSTLLGAISRAEPKVGDYPFTTLRPQLGICELSKGEHDRGRRLVVADIPGLIEHADQGAGMGVRFLRHVERCRVLLHLLECDPTDGSDPMANYRAIRAALEGYSPELAARPEVVILSKADLMPNPDDRAVLAEMMVTELGIRPRFMSAATGEGVHDMLEALWQASGKSAQTERPDWNAL